jgi:hypothetical protein
VGTDEPWREQRARAVAAHAAERERRAVVEAEQARQLVAGFARTARERGLPAEPLVARGYDGKGRYRTGLRGWYLRSDGGLAVSTEGDFYVLTVAPSLAARVRGVALTPDTPRLVIGEGGRDGERIGLQQLLERRLTGEH